MGCEFYQDLLIDQIAGELSEEDRVRVEQHLAECEECVIEVDRLRRLTQAALPAGELEATRRVESRLLAELKQRQGKRSIEPQASGRIGAGFRGWLLALFGQPSRALASVAGIVAAIAIGFILGQWGPRQWGETDRSPQAQPIREQIETNEAGESDGLADHLGAIDDSLNRSGGSSTGRGWIRFATTPTDAISLAESFPTDTL